MANVFCSAALAGPSTVRKLSSRMSRAAIRDVQRNLLHAVFQFARLTRGIAELRKGRDESRCCPFTRDAIGPVATLGSIGPPPSRLVFSSPRNAVVAPIRRTGDGISAQCQSRKIGVEGMAHDWTYPRDRPQASQSAAIDSIFPRWDGGTGSQPVIAFKAQNQ